MLKCFVRVDTFLSYENLWPRPRKKDLSTRCDDFVDDENNDEDDDDDDNNKNNDGAVDNDAINVQRRPELCPAHKKVETNGGKSFASDVVIKTFNFYFRWWWQSKC